MKDKPGELIVILFLLFLLLFLLGVIGSAPVESRDPQPGLQVQLLEIEGMTCVAVYTLNSDTGHEFATIAGVSCNWDEYEAPGPVWVDADKDSAPWYVVDNGLARELALYGNLKECIDD